MISTVTKEIQNQEYQILVRTKKGDLGLFKYAAVDTIKTLNEKIQESCNIPTSQQILYANYGLNKCYQRQLLDEPDDKLINRLKDVVTVTVYDKLAESISMNSAI